MFAQTVTPLSEYYGWWLDQKKKRKEESRSSYEQQQQLHSKHASAPKSGLSLLFVLEPGAVASVALNITRYYCRFPSFLKYSRPVTVAFHSSTNVDPRPPRVPLPKVLILIDKQKREYTHDVFEPVDITRPLNRVDKAIHVGRNIIKFHSIMVSRNVTQQRGRV